MTKEEKGDAFAKHEALHMAWFLMQSVDNELLEHSVIKGHADWAELAAVAHKALFDLYQSIGARTVGVE